MYQTAFDPCDSLIIHYYESNQKHNMKIQHYHDTYEIYLQTCGERYLFLNDICYTLKKGDLYILKPFVIHYTESREADYYGRYLLNFAEEKLDMLLKVSERHILFDRLESGIFHLEEEQYDTIFSLFCQIAKRNGKSGFLADKLQYSIVFQLVMTLNEMIRENTALREISSSAHVQTEITEAIQYLSRHYQEAIDLDTVAEQVHMSKYHFCRMFHKATGATFLEHLNNIRLTKVHQMLLDTNLPLRGIVERTGFSSTAHLSRVFRSVYHVSPSAFRQNAKEQLHSKL